VSRERRYWDSDCFLGWLRAEPDKQEACRGVLEEAQSGSILIVTSALTIAEVLALRGRPKVASDRRRAVEQFFRHDYISVQNLTRRLAESAREVVWDNGIAPKDAIHVATALATQVASLNTFDIELIKKSGLVGVPALTICRPFVNAPKLDLRQPKRGE
jgi:predicted nucleic acid-binding protein